MSDTEELSLEGLDFATLELAEKDHIFTITLNRPKRKNAMNAEMTTELAYALDWAKQERRIRCVVIAANGDTFCAGGDLRSMSGNPEGGVVSNVPKRDDSNDVAHSIRHLYKPVICKIQGSVLAGALLMVCNATHAIAADHAKFSAPEILRGIWPFMVMAGLFRVMPKREGLDFIMRGQPISAEEAADKGLINRAVPAAELDSEVDTLAQEFTALAPGTMQVGLKGYIEQSDQDFDDALAFLRTQIAAVLQSPDAREGISAFLEKREPKWD
jgi:enoyl-CoA hydratase/carnithine racemase